MHDVERVSGEPGLVNLPSENWRRPLSGQAARTLSSGTVSSIQRVRRRCFQGRGSPQPVYGRALADDDASPAYGRSLPRCSGLPGSAFGFGSVGFAVAVFFVVAMP
jgi:hypothetical protein